MASWLVVLLSTKCPVFLRNPKVAVEPWEIPPASIDLLSSLIGPGPHKVSLVILLNFRAPKCKVLAEGNVVRVAVSRVIRIHVAAEFVVRVALLPNSDLFNSLITKDL